MELNAENISRRYMRKRKESNFFYAVKGINLSLKSGHLTAITGRSGSGKSTLLHVMAGLLAPTEGKLLLDGKDVYALEDRELSRLRNESFGIIPQGQSALMSLSVKENVLAPTLLWQKQENFEERAMTLLEQVGIARLSGELPGELSGGELRRMAIARALILSPRVIFADEPTGDLDDENTQAVLKLLRARADEGCAVLLVTHELDALPYADEAWQMKEGNLTPQP